MHHIFQTARIEIASFYLFYEAPDITSFLPLEDRHSQVLLLLTSLQPIDLFSLLQKLSLVFLPLLLKLSFRLVNLVLQEPVVEIAKLLLLLFEHLFELPLRRVLVSAQLLQLF